MRMAHRRAHRRIWAVLAVVLPLLFLAMLTAILFYGPGKLSIDAFIRRHYMGR